MSWPEAIFYSIAAGGEGMTPSAKLRKAKKALALYEQGHVLAAEVMRDDPDRVWMVEERAELDHCHAVYRRLLQVAEEDYRRERREGTP